MRAIEESRFERVHVFLAGKDMQVSSRGIANNF
jgi:hypothetical protein